MNFQLTELNHSSYLILSIGFLLYTYICNHNYIANEISDRLFFCLYPSNLKINIYNIGDSVVRLKI